LEQDANQVLFLYRDEYYNPDTPKKRIAEVIVAKNRGGEIGTVELYFNATLTKFTDLEKIK
jgi:replicative DNA helicase